MTNPAFVTFDTLKFKVTDTVRNLILTIKTMTSAISNHSIYLSMPNNKYAVSYYSTLAQTTNFPFGDLNGIVTEQQIPLAFSLSQNYPNPFNPTTIITYTLAKKSFAVVKVYDVIGREIATLLNNERDAGLHKIEFDANFYKGLSSGIYFYKIEALEPLSHAVYFTDVKKMALIK